MRLLSSNQRLSSLACTNTNRFTLGLFSKWLKGPKYKLNPLQMLIVVQWFKIRTLTCRLTGASCTNKLKVSCRSIVKGLIVNKGKKKSNVENFSNFFFSHFPCKRHYGIPNFFLKIQGIFFFISIIFLTILILQISKRK